MIREIEVKDLDSVNKILNYFNFNINPSDLNKDFFNSIVYEENGIKGIMVYDLIYDRIEIEYIIVESSERRQGIATKMVEYIEKKYKYIQNITLEVRESNIGAIKFYESIGFRRVSIRKNYYGNENGILMMK